MTASSCRGCAAVIGLAVAARVGAAIYLGNIVTPLPGVFDQVSYHTLALRVLDGHGFSFGEGWWPATAANQPTAHWSFLYACLLRSTRSAAQPAGRQARPGRCRWRSAAAPDLPPGSRLFGRRVGLVSAAIVACYAYFVYYSAALVTESCSSSRFCGRSTPALELADAGPAERQAGPVSAVGSNSGPPSPPPSSCGRWSSWSCRSSWSGCGGGHGSRKSGEPAESGRAPRGWPVALPPPAWSSSLCVAPWTIRNYGVFHRFVLLNTNAGFAFYWGNHPVHGNGFVPILPGPEYGRLIPGELRGAERGPARPGADAKRLSTSSPTPRFASCALPPAGSPSTSSSGPLATQAPSSNWAQGPVLRRLPPVHGAGTLAGPV